jgi:hypothetical protein
VAHAAPAPYGLYSLDTVGAATVKDTEDKGLTSCNGRTQAIWNTLKTVEVTYSSRSRVLVNGARWQLSKPAEGVDWATALNRTPNGIEVSVSFGIDDAGKAEGVILVLVMQKGKPVCGDARGVGGRYKPLRG